MLQILILGDSRVAMMEKMYLEWKSRGVISPQDIFHFCINRGKTMEDFIAPLKEFKLKNRYNSIKMVVFITMITLVLLTWILDQTQYGSIKNLIERILQNMEK